MRPDPGLGVAFSSQILLGRPGTETKESFLKLVLTWNDLGRPRARSYWGRDGEWWSGCRATIAGVHRRRRDIFARWGLHVKHAADNLTGMRGIRTGK
ncbi:hypothetical protein C2W62_09400 [Candidatus Entotheonella serta]|nr:hypothetical protein C2W62_09400 [Candidatus Entotheonella serta]